MVVNGNVLESMGPVVFKLQRKFGTAGNITVNFTVTDVNTNSTDLNTRRNDIITFTDGETMKFLNITIVDDLLQEDNEQFIVDLTGAVGAVTRAAALIIDDETHSQWSEWIGDCSVTCGPANKTETRSRTCIAFDPQRCNLPLNESRVVECGLPDCPVFTAWSEWADNGTCSTTCGPGTQMQFRERNCTANCPPDVILIETRTVTCEQCTCPVISEWTEWADNGTCSTTCGPGTQMQFRTRNCTNSTCCPSNFTSTETRTVTCEICPCPVIGPWCPWVNVGPCSVTCGCGTQMQARHRVCVNTCIPPDCVKREERTVNYYVDTMEHLVRDTMADMVQTASLANMEQNETTGMEPR
ncbi:properdin-like [Haliotis asinina]|uniref:properdin-like n=1 Tax=Haliotis asinina TaxID=109174 RepID=UPI0035323E37